MCKLVSGSFNPPNNLKIGEFFLRTLSYEDAEVDYQAVMSSIDIIQKTRGGNWPTRELTLEDNKIDLAWHQREFEFGNSFAYCVWDLEEKEYLGCIYFYPAGFRGDVPKGTDVDISLWVTQKAYDKGLYLKLFRVVKEWVQKDWPFKKPFYSNKEM